jgi:hypothetical protein
VATLDDLLEEARLLAMRAVAKPDGEYYVRRLCRWYSQTYATPLHVVETEIPIEDVFMHYFESKYERMEEEEREIEMDEILLTPAEREQRKVDAEAAKQADDDFLKEAIEEAEQAKAKNPELARMDKALTEDDKGMRMPLIPVMGTSKPLNEAVLENRSAPLSEIPQNIKMEFVDDLGDLDEWDITGPTKPDGEK